MGADLHLPRWLLPLDPVGVAQLPGLIDNLLHEVRGQRSQHPVEELPLRLVGGGPLVWDVPVEPLHADGLRPHGPHAKLWPVGHEELWHILPWDHGLLVPEDLLHEAQRTAARLGQEKLHVVTEVSVEVGFAPVLL